MMNVDEIIEQKPVNMGGIETNQAQHIIHEEERRRYDPDAVFQLELNSDSEDDS